MPSEIGAVFIYLADKCKREKNRQRFFYGFALATECESVKQLKKKHPIYCRRDGYQHLLGRTIQGNAKTPKVTDLPREWQSYYAVSKLNCQLYCILIQFNATGRSW